MNKFDLFLKNLPYIKNQNELTNLICTLGLFYDNRNLYKEYEKFMVQDGGGIWQNPEELATFLWETKTLFKENNIKSYLDIGTFNGYTFFIISNFLKVFVNKDIKVCSIDPEIHIEHSIKEYIKNDIKNCTSFDIFDSFDLVFIDGCHTGEWPMNDFKNALKLNCKFAFFHDIVDKYCPDVNKTWSIISKEFKTNEFCKSRDTFGIGLVNLL